MTYEVQFQIGEVPHVVRGPDVDGVLRLFAGLKAQDAKPSVAAQTETNQSSPWYPDDSGEWVEVPDDCMACPVGWDVPVQALRADERENKEYENGARSAGSWNWSAPADEDYRIVAYRIVK